MMASDHVFFAAWTLTACVLALLFGVLHLMAAVSAMRKGYRPYQLVMLAGGVISLLAAPACLFGWAWNMDAVLMALGGGAVCGAAFYNGRSAAAEAGDGKLFHLSHHMVRLAFVLILVLNFIRV